MDSVQSMASSSSSTVPSSERTSHFISQTEMEMESAKARHWSQLDYSTRDSEWSPETNFHYFALLKEDPQWCRFFTDFPALEVGKKISGGAQADIYEARNTCDGSFNLVVKVMKGGAPLEHFQAQWPIGMLSARSKHKHLFDLPLISILGGTVLRDQRLRGRFAFVMHRRWGDLRLLIDRRMKQERSTPGPFPIDEAIHLMLSIAEDMDTLHRKHDILHRDLKASNVLVWGEFGEDMSLNAVPNRVARIGSVVADFECSVGVLGTRSWMAPEILEKVKDRVPCSEVLFTRESDVYSYGMTCYEIITGCIPYDGCGGKDMVSQILNGRRPELPHELLEYLRDILTRCWHSDPSERPTFSAICMALKGRRGPNPVSVVIDTTSKRGASILKVEQWINPHIFTLLEVMQTLMDLDILVLKASNLSSTTMIMQYFEVIDRKGRKVEDYKCIANIRKALWSLSCQVLDKMEWSTEIISLNGNVDENTIVRMHVVEVVAEKFPGLLRNLSRLLVAMNFKFHSAGCSAREDRLECVIYVEGARICALLWALRYVIYPPQSLLSFIPESPQRFKIAVHRVATGEFSHLKRRLHNLKSMDLTPRYRASNISIRQEKGFLGESSYAEAGVYLEEGCRLVDVSRNFTNLHYEIIRAAVECSGPYKFLKGRAKTIKGVDVGTLGEDESRKIYKILDAASESGCPAVNGQLIVSGPSKALHDDLIRSFREDGLSIAGGEVSRDTRSFYSGYLELFVTDKAAPGAGQYSSMLPFYVSG